MTTLFSLIMILFPSFALSSGDVYGCVIPNFQYSEYVQVFVSRNEAYIHHDGINSSGPLSILDCLPDTHLNSGNLLFCKGFTKEPGGVKGFAVELHFYIDKLKLYYTFYSKYETKRSEFNCIKETKE